MTWSQTIQETVFRGRDFEELAEDHLWAWEPDAPSCLTLPPNLQTLMDLCAQKPCPQNSHCLQTGPSFQCLCLQGWTGPLCNLPLSSCQRVALSQGTNPRPAREQRKSKKVSSSNPSLRTSTHNSWPTDQLKVEATHTNQLLKLQLNNPGQPNTTQLLEPRSTQFKQHYAAQPIRLQFNTSTRNITQ